MAVARPLSWLSFVSSLWTAWVWSVPLPPVTLATASPTAADQQGEFCSPTLCGGVNFSFPFGIVPDHATETNCGVPRFLVLCSNNTPYFGSSPYSFRILDIFYDNSSLLIADVRKLEGFHSSASKPCRSPTNNSSTKVGLPFSISPVNQNMIFYDCVEPPAQAVRKSRGLVNTVCGNKTLVGVTKGPDVPGIYFLEGCNATVVPMLARSGEVNPANYMEIISDGFLLTWQRSPSPSPLSSPAGACGGLNITYPFWLEEPGRQPCGPPSFQLKCNSNRVFLTKSVYQAYEVLSIFTKNNSFHMVDHNLPLATGCPAPTVNISLFSPGTFVLSKTNKELLFLGKCTGFPPADSAGFHSLPCDNSSFVRLGDGRNFSSHGIQGGIPPGCLFSVAPFFGSPDGNGDDYVASMGSGLLVEWKAVPDGCPKCMAWGGECRYYGDTGNEFACDCSGDKCGVNRRNGRKIALKCVGGKIGLIGLIVTASLLLPCIYVLIWHRQKLRFFLCKKTSSTIEENIEALILAHGLLAPKRYKYSEVPKITSSLNNKLGEGGYGMVFKGRLDDGRLVAVKFLHDSKGDGEEFVNEVMSIGRTSHINIVSLFGFCLEGSKRALIYEYMPNGSLDKYIYSENPKAILGWDKLYTIAIGIARGLEYLHHSCNTHIVHFDIKPQNILLDQNFHPKIADFGLAKLCPAKESKLSMTGARGTPGFIAPEVHSRTFGVVSTKADVYSYGMMLLEMVGGRKNVESVAQESSEKYFPHWIYDHFGQDDGLQACEVTLDNEGIAKKMSVIGLWCIQILPMHRPTIGKVLEMFERGLDELDMPPRQNFSQIFEEPVYSLNAESSIMISGTKTQVSSEVLKMKEINVVNSKILRRLPTL